MADIQALVTDNLDIWTSAIKTQSTSGRGSRKKLELTGIKKLRELILELAVRGKLVPQDPNDEPASVLLEKIAVEKEQLIKDKKIKKQKNLPKIDKDEEPFKLPLGWVWSRLGNITNYGLFDKVESNNVETNTWILELEDVEKETSRLLKKVRFKDRRFKSTKNCFNYNDVIYGKLRPYLDKVIVADESGVCTTEMIPFHAYYGIESKFLRLLLKSPFFIHYANNSTHGMNLPRLGTDKARIALLPVAPQMEQHRIVTKVDELMALCDQLEQQTEASITAHQTLVDTLLDALVNSDQDATAFADSWTLIEQNFNLLFTTEQSIDKLKQTILQLAVMGKLVPQDPNDEPASVLLEKIAAEKERLIKEKKIKKQKTLINISDEDKEGNLPLGWSRSYMQDITKVVTCGMASTPKYQNSGKIFLSAKNIKPNRFMPEEHKFVDEETFRKITQSAYPEKGDILLTRVGAGIGEAAVVNIDIEFAFYVSLTLIKPFLNYVDSYYLLYWLNSSEGVKKSIDNIYGRGVSQGNLNVKQVREFIIPIPPLTEQHRIVAKIDELMALCDNLKSQLTNKKITQQSLAAAFVEKTLVS